MFNIVCFGLGVGMCIWLTWLESREQLQGSAKSTCAAISRWRICQPCCKKGIGIWLRASQAEWAENPLDKELELKEFRTSVLGDDELITVLRQEIKMQAEENKKQAEELSLIHI